MTSKPGFVFGLSEVEKDDLESLIRTVRDDASDPCVREEREPEEWRGRLSRLEASILEMDGKIQILREIVRLSLEKSDLYAQWLDRAPWRADGLPTRRAP